MLKIILEREPPRDLPADFIFNSGIDTILLPLFAIPFGAFEIVMIHNYYQFLYCFFSDVPLIVFFLISILPEIVWGREMTAVTLRTE